MEIRIDGPPECNVCSDRAEATFRGMFWCDDCLIGEIGGGDRREPPGSKKTGGQAFPMAEQEYKGLLHEGMTWLDAQAGQIAAEIYGALSAAAIRCVAELKLAGQGDGVPEFLEGVARDFAAVPGNAYSYAAALLAEKRRVESE